MASTNQSPAYQKTHGKFLAAETDEEKIKFLEEMIRECPKHKSSENMLSNLKTRYKKFKEKIEKSKKIGKSSKGKKGIKKEDFQVVIIGFTGTGKSSLLSKLTNAKPLISVAENLEKFCTKTPEIGIMPYQGVNIQIIENPSIESEYYDKSLTHTADTILILITELNQIPQIEKTLEKAAGKKIIVFNKSDTLTENEKRKISETLKSKHKRYNFSLISVKSSENMEELKDKIFQTFDKIRVYTKEPDKTVEEAKKGKPIILEKNSNILKIAEKVFRTSPKEIRKIIKETKIWGPSSKFSGQVVGLKHTLKDLDIVEFKTR